MSPVLLVALASATLPASPIPPEMINRIADASFNHGRVVETAAYLADHIGGRMTNSPAMREAERWTQRQFNEWGLMNVRREAFDFGRGWWIESSTVRMVEPRSAQMRGIPIAWTPSTNGPLAADIFVAPMSKTADFAKWRGKLRGKIVLVTYPRAPADETGLAFQRFSPADIQAFDAYKAPIADPKKQARDIDSLLFEQKLDGFLKEEGALAWVRMSERENGLVEGEVINETFKVGKTPTLPAVELSAEDYRKLTRLALSGPTRLEINNNVHYDDSDHNAYNILADLPGRDPRAGYVMAGAHLDSWVGGDGAADNGAGVAVVMEAARILSALRVQPRRTIRFALWAGEEQGALGSYSYVESHLARRPKPTDQVAASVVPWWWIDNAYPIEKLPTYGDLAGYFNIDNGSGKIRGIYAQNNFAAAPILKQWLSPFSSMGADAVVMRINGGSDHVFMEKVGLPAFSFIQDPLDYEPRVHHSNVDTFDHLRPNDLRQAAVILAAILLDAAEADRPLPANILPTSPSPTDPFAYENTEKK